MQSFLTDLQRATKEHSNMRCYDLGLGLDTFRMVALTSKFRRLDAIAVNAAYLRCVLEKFPQMFCKALRFWC